MKEVFELEIYRLAEELSDLIWKAFDQWPEKVQRTIGYQVIRAADSIAANLAEGYGRFTPADRKIFYRYARGSFEETKAWLRKLIRRQLLSDEQLNAFIRSTK